MSLIARATVVPVLARPTLRAEQVTQLVLGETARVHAAAGEWRRIVTDADAYGGWVHTGYFLEVTADAAAVWRHEATGWSEGAVLHLDDGELRVPLRARLALVDAGAVRLPDGRKGEVVEGAVRAVRDAVAAARAMPPAEWAAERFRGSPYVWGGVTPWGVDCSGLVQTTFAARGVSLPRDAAQQARCGRPVPAGALASGDLLFFRAEAGRAEADHTEVDPTEIGRPAETGRGATSPRITHVAFAGPADTLVHAAVAHGGVIVEPRTGERAQMLLRRLVAVRRLETS